MSIYICFWCLFLVVLLFGLSGVVLVYNLICECEEVQVGEICCKGGFFDGSGVFGVIFDVIGYDEQILVFGKFGVDLILIFKCFDGEFYVLFDVGFGYVVEIDYVDIVVL